jgi:cation diffusion facilitator CzcD-associated flavoprotein CzcO
VLQSGSALRCTAYTPARPAQLPGPARRASKPVPWPGKQVCVMGGANSAGQAALHLAKFATRVALLVRGELLAASMSDYLIT